MSTRASYDELIKHVRSLEEENTHLRRELLFSSSGHLVSRLENEPTAVLPSSSRDSNVGTNRQPAAAAVSTVLTGNGHHTSMTDSLNSKQSIPLMIGSMHESTSQGVFPFYNKLIVIRTYWKLICLILPFVVSASILFDDDSCRRLM